MTYLVRPALGHNPWLVRPWLDRGVNIVGATIHSTRSGVSGDDEHDDGPGTERWGMHPDNGSAAQGWGTFWDRLIWRDGTRLICTDVATEYASWTAGFGALGGPTEWALGHYYIQYEIAQSRADQPFSLASIDSLAQNMAEDAQTYNFPIERIHFVSQQEIPPPRGITTHEGSANGIKLGKTDPGELFPWDTFIELAKDYLGDEDMALKDDVKALQKQVATMEARHARDNMAFAKRRDIRELADGPWQHAEAAWLLLKDDGHLRVGDSDSLGS